MQKQSRVLKTMEFNSKELDKKYGFEDDTSALWTTEGSIREVISRGTAEAVINASCQKSSDSCMSQEASDEDSLIQKSSFELKNPRSLSEDAWIEAESIEAASTDPSGAKLLSRGKSIVESEFCSSTVSETWSESACEVENSKVILKSDDSILESHEDLSSLPTASPFEAKFPNDTEGILLHCGALRNSGNYLGKHAPKHEEALIITHNNAQAEYDSQSCKDSSGSGEHSNPHHESAGQSDVNCLYALFVDFCKPHPTYSSVEMIYNFEKQQEILGKETSLPIDALIIMSKDNDSGLFQLLKCHRHLLQLPSAFQLSFFRILIRILTNKTDMEYNQDCLFTRTSGPNSETKIETGANRRKSGLNNLSIISDPKVQDLQKATHERVQGLRTKRKEIGHMLRTAQLSFEERFRNPQSTTSSSNFSTLVYRFVRFQYSHAWGNASAVSILLDLLELVRISHTYLVPPLINLIGFLSTAGASVSNISRMVQIASEPIESEYFLDRLLMVRALSIAANGEFQATFLVGKASPKNFFSFGKSSEGISRTINSLSNWPFRNDFGFAVWFRCDSFDQSEDPIILSISSVQGSGIDVSLTSLNDSNSARVIAVTVCDIESSEVETVFVKNCVLLPRVWYHLGIRHTRSRLKGVFSLSSRQQISVMLDGKIMMTEPLKFPSTPSYDFQVISSPKSFLSGLQIGKTNSMSLTIRFGVNFEGQAGALYIFSDNVSDATLKSIYRFTAGIKREADQNESSRSETPQTKKTPNKSVVELNLADADEVVISDIGASNTKTLSSNVIDLCDLGESERDILPELSHASFRSKLFLVWDPKRIEGQMLLDLHSGFHVLLDPLFIKVISMESAKDVISSIGGVQCLLPIFDTLLSGNIERKLSLQSNCKAETVEQNVAALVVPALFSMLSAFIRNHYQNAREMMRSGGIDIIEQQLSRNIESTHGSQSVVIQSTTTPWFAKILLDSLLEMRMSCEHYPLLENAMFERLLFNLRLWFGIAPDSIGIPLFPALLSVLSSITKLSPQKVRDHVGIWPFLEILPLFTDVGDSEKELSALSREPATHLFDRSDAAGLLVATRLTIRERRQIIDIILGMIAMIVNSGIPSSQLSSLLSYIAFNADYEWDKGSRRSKLGENPNIRIGTRLERHRANVKATAILCSILKVRPAQMESIARITFCCGNPQIFMAWILSTLINTFDDEMRSIGIRCLADYIEILHSKPELLHYEVGDASNGLEGNLGGRLMGRNGKRMSDAFTSVGKTLTHAMGTQVLHSVNPTHKLVNIDIVYKLLWHLLKCHRARMGRATYTALIYLVVEDHLQRDLLSNQLVLPDKVLHLGYVLDIKQEQDALQEIENVSGKMLRQNASMKMLLRLLRFLPTQWLDKWLYDLVTLIDTCPLNVKMLVEDPDWQSSLFHVLSNCLEEMRSKCKNKNSTTNKKAGFETLKSLNLSFSERLLEVKEVRSGELTHSDDNLAVPEEEGLRSIQKRFDLSFKIYRVLLAHCFRSGGDEGISAVEQAASLERICVNGHDVLCIILNHLLSELIQKGTIDSLVINTKNVLDTTLLLRESAKMVTEAILAKGSNSSVDASFAVAQWHALRHLVVVVNCVISKCGLGMGDLLNDCMKLANRVDPISGGLYGIRLPEGNSAPINAEKYRKILIQGNDFSDNGNPSDYYRHICVHLSSQILTLIEAFILPKCLDARLPTYQRHGLALVRTNEARLGSSQGPVLASLIRLSLVMICNLEPSSKTFLQCCWRLRCFLQWALELIKESVALAGFSAAFHDLTAPLDRLLLAIVLHSHSALSICATLLSTFEYPFAEGIDDEAGKIKSGRRLIQVCFVLRELVVTAFRGRNEVLRAALSHDVFQALQESLENTTERNLQQQSSQEVVVREFLASEWVSMYHDIRLNDRASDTLQEKQSLESQSRSTRKGSLVMHQLSEESFQNILDFTRALDVPFKMYLEDQRRWAETDLVRDLEYEGDEAIKRFSLDYKESITESRRRSLERSIGTDGRWNVVVRQVIDLWTSHSAHWKLGENRDCLGRRIVLVRNKAFDKHENASYEQMLGLDRERREMEVEERRRKKAEKEQEELLDVLMKNSAYVPYGSDAMLEDDEVCGVDEAASNQETLKEEIDSSNQGVRPETNKAEELIIEVEPERLEQVFPVGIGDEDQWAKSFVWDDIECIVARFPEVEIVTLRAIAKGKLLLTSHSIYFCPFDSINVVTKKVIDGWHNEEQTKHIASRWRLNRLSEAHSRRYILRAQAIELFFVDGNDLFLHFSLGVRERDRFYAKLRNSCKVPLLSSPRSLNPRVAFKKSKITQLWRRGKMTNFEYLMHVNKFAGRTFNDLTQYPVFPWILSDYTSDTIDLTDSRVYRDLSKPIGALNEDRLAILIERYKELESFGFAESQRFLYGSHYSSPGVVLHFLIRQEPFTSMAIELQSGRFDCPDRLFFDVAGCWASCMMSTSDVKELIPELFTCPECLLNTNQFPLGRTQDNREISNVTLPPWARGCAHEFIRIHRLALESDYVSQNLNSWIDLIFGYKQRGPDAESAHNLFHYLSYEGSVDMTKIADELERKATESQIQNFGQTPSQLLPKDPHPTKLSVKDLWKPLVYNREVAYRMICFTPLRQFAPKQTKAAVASIHVLTDNVLVMFSDSSIGYYKFSASKKTSKRPFIFHADKHRFMASHELKFSHNTIKKATNRQHFEDSTISRLPIKSSSFAVTLGGIGIETVKKKIQNAGRLNTYIEPLKEAEATGYIISCGYWDDTVKVHSMDGAKVLCSEAGGHRGAIRCLSMCSDSPLLITGGQDATCRVWVVDHIDLAVALGDGYTQTAQVGSNAGTGLLKLCHVLWGHRHPIACLDMSSELDIAVSGDLGGLICVHTIRRGEFIRSILPIPNEASYSVQEIALSHTGTFVAYLDNQSLHCITVNNAHLCSTYVDDEINAMKLTSDGEILVTGGKKGHVVIRSAHDLLELSSLDLSKHGPIRCVSFTPDILNPIPQFLFVGSEDGLVTLLTENKDASLEEEIVTFV